MGQKAIFMKVMSENFLQLIKDTSPQIQAAQLISGMTNKRKCQSQTHFHESAESQNIEHLKSSQKKKHYLQKSNTWFINDFLTVTMKDRKQWNSIFNVLTIL